MTFIPETPSTPTLHIPYYEDITAKDLPGREVEKPLDWYQKRITNALTALGAFRISYILGQFPGEPTRYGFQIGFVLNGIHGRIDCAALPMRTETPKKKDRALAQALYLVALHLEAEVSSLMWRPGAVPLLPYLLGNAGKTVTEALVERRILPDFTPRQLNGGQS